MDLFGAPPEPGRPAQQAAAADDQFADFLSFGGDDGDDVAPAAAARRLSVGEKSSAAVDFLVDPEFNYQNVVVAEHEDSPEGRTGPIALLRCALT
jgi:hypothetical protein